MSRTLRTAGASGLALAALATVLAFVFLRAQAGAPDLSGAWNLQLEGDAIFQCALEIEQDGTELSGNWSCPYFGEGTFTGVAAEELGELAFTLAGELEGVGFEAEGTLAPDGRNASGTWRSEELDLDGFFVATRKDAGGTATPPSAVVGDANCNEDVDSIDAALILQLSAALLEQLACEGDVDVNDDGYIDSLDALLVLQYVAGLLDGLPPAGPPGSIFY